MTNHQNRKIPRNIRKKNYIQNTIHLLKLLLVIQSVLLSFAKLLPSGFSKKVNECVSSDRIFRVRSKQPHNVKEMLSNDSKSDDALPTVSKILKLGDLCVFQMQDGNEWCIGRVLQFAKFKGKTVGHQECKEWSVDLSTKNIGVLCTWYELQRESPLVLKYVVSMRSSHTHTSPVQLMCVLSQETAFKVALRVK